MSEREYILPDKEAAVFAQIAGELEGQVTDPYLDTVHGMAREYQTELRTGQVAPQRHHQMIQHLNEQWQEYAGRTVKLTGAAWVELPGYPQPVQQYYDGQPAVSGGFTTFTLIREDGTAIPSIAHRLTLDTLQARVAAVAPLDDLHQLELPYPSEELRIRRFAYDYPEHAGLVQELVATALRPDQLLRDLQEFSLTIDLSSPDGIEHAQDAQVYINKWVGLDKLANYRIELAPSAPLLLIRGDDLLVHRDLPDGYTAILHCDEIVLRPRDITTIERTGVHELVPYISGKILLPDLDQDVLVPCSAIGRVHSLRYSNYPMTEL